MLPTASSAAKRKEVKGRFPLMILLSCCVQRFLSRSANFPFLVSVPVQKPKSRPTTDSGLDGREQVRLKGTKGGGGVGVLADQVGDFLNFIVERRLQLVN